MQSEGEKERHGREFTRVHDGHASHGLNVLDMSDLSLIFKEL